MNTETTMTVSAEPSAVPTLPSEYRPLHQLNLCSNLLIDVQVAILFRNIPLLLVGDGPFPLVWLAGPTDPKLQTWRWVVEKSISRSNLINVEVDASTSEVRVFAKADQVLNARLLGQSYGGVTLLDLRPFGFAVQGSQIGLAIGGTRMNGNQFVGARSAVRLA